MPASTRPSRPAADSPLTCVRLTLQLTRGIEKTVAQLVEKLAETSTEVTDDGLADVAAVSAGNNRVVRPTPCTQMLPPPAPSCSMGVSEAVEEVEAPNSGCCQSSQGQRPEKSLDSRPSLLLASAGSPCVGNIHHRCCGHLGGRP